MLPSDVNARKIVLKRVQEAVQSLNEIDGLKEDMKALAEACKDEYDMKPAEFKFNNLVKVMYNREKVESQIEQLQTSLSEADMLSN